MNSCTPMNKPIQPDGKRDRNVDKCKEEQMKLKIKSFVLKDSPTTIKIERRGCSMLTRSKRTSRQDFLHPPRTQTRSQLGGDAISREAESTTCYHDQLSL
mmetsp:Transcript_34970/g.87043  ORF Transcript_34970/g.87043 Transcript_34970/m.87043 type:complete len:100 (+) Transcript_34970:191-490(+)